MVKLSDDDTAVKMESSDRPGAIVVNVIALLSALALTFIAFRVSWLALRYFLNPYRPKQYARETIFFRTRMGIYAASMLAGNLFSSIAGAFGWWWVAQRQVSPGSMCTGQAVLMSMGNFLGAYFTVALGFHTFNSLVLRYRQSIWLGALIIAGGWSFALILALFPLSPSLATKSVSMYGPGEIGCGIQSVYSTALFYHHLFPIFLCALLSAVLYSLIFLALRGFISFRGGIRINLNTSGRWNGSMGTLEDYHRFVLAVGRNMLWFAVAYIVLLLPYSITRLMILAGSRVSTAAVMFAFACWYLLGIVNVVILYTIFRLLSPALVASTATALLFSRAKSRFAGKGDDDVEHQEPVSMMLTPLSHEFPVLHISAKAIYPTSTRDVSLQLGSDIVSAPIPSDPTFDLHTLASKGTRAVAIRPLPPVPGGDSFSRSGYCDSDDGAHGPPSLHAYSARHV